MSGESIPCVSTVQLEIPEILQEPDDLLSGHPAATQERHPLPEFRDWESCPCRPLLQFVLQIDDGLLEGGMLVPGFPEVQKITWHRGTSHSRGPAEPSSPEPG